MTSRNMHCTTGDALDGELLVLSGFFAGISLAVSQYVHFILLHGCGFQCDPLSELSAYAFGFRRLVSAHLRYKRYLLMTCERSGT